MSAIHKIDYEGGLILTGRWKPTDALVEKIKQSNIPALHAPVISYDAMKMITSFTAKIRKGDRSKVEKAINVIENHINFDALCDFV